MQVLCEKARTQVQRGEVDQETPRNKDPEPQGHDPGIRGEERTEQLTETVEVGDVDDHFCGVEISIAGGVGEIVRVSPFTLYFSLIYLSSLVFYY